MSLLDDIKKEEAGMSLLDELQNTPEETKEFVESEQWRPEPGEGIEGVIVDIYSFDTEYSQGVPGWVLKVDGDDTLWSVAGLWTVLRGEMEKANAQIGDRVAIIYSGKRQGKNNGSAYHHHRLAIRRGNGAIPTQQSRSQSTQHEDLPAKPRRKPGQPKPVLDEAPF